MEICLLISFVDIRYIGGEKKFSKSYDFYEHYLWWEPSLMEIFWKMLFNSLRFSYCLLSILMMQKLLEPSFMKVKEINTVKITSKSKKKNISYLIRSCCEKVNEINCWKSSLYDFWKDTVTTEKYSGLIAYRLHINSS